MSKPVLYHCPQTRGRTTYWMNEELGEPCDIKLLDIRAGAHKDPEFTRVNPMGKVPTLVHDGVVVTESAAICAYLADAFPAAGLAPATTDPRRGSYLRWLFFAPSCIEPAMLDKLSGQERENTGSAGHGSVEDVVKTVEHALTQTDGPYILGEAFSAADVVFGSAVSFAMMFGAFEKTPLLTDYVDRLVARPAAKAADKKNAALAKDLGWT